MAKKGLSCPAPLGEGSKGTKEEKTGKYRRSKFYKTVDYSEKENKPPQHKVERPTKLIVSDAMKEQRDPGSKGVTFEGAGSKEALKKYNVKEGDVKAISATIGNTDQERSRVKETRYFKKRSKLGKKLTGEDVKQVGGRIETEKSGQVETIAFKGKGKRARLSTKQGNVTEGYKEAYDKAKSDVEAKGKRASFKDVEDLKHKTYIRAKVADTKEGYRLGTEGKDTGEQIKVKKPILKVKRKGSTRVSKSALQSMSKYGKG